ncbi:MAG: T9SS type A sorting domain-containing protein [Bacteroidetes bacterium]|nr:T9SS type A sorting domain-containing protein [Bacteroidota bacterium]
MKASIFIPFLISFWFYFLFISLSNYAQNITVDWIQKKPHTIGRLISFDKSGNIIACGTYGNSSPNWSDIITIKYDSLGTEIWSATYDDTLFNGLDRCMALAIDTFNNVYVAGVTNLPYDFTFTNSQGVLIKYNEQGVFEWKRSWGNSAGFAASFNSMKLLNNKDIYISGYANPISTGDPHSLLMKYDSSGNVQWVHVDSSTTENYISQIEADKSGNIYAVGTTSCCPPTYRMRLEKYRPDGTRQWEHVLIDTLYNYGYGGGIVIDDSANCYLLASISYSFSPSGYDGGIAKIDSAGNKKWLFPFVGNPPSYSGEDISNVLINSKNELFCKGTLTGSNNIVTSLVINLNPINGSINWMFQDTTLKSGGTGQLYNDTLGILSNGAATGGLPTLISLCNQVNGDTVWTCSLFAGHNYTFYSLLFQRSNYYLYGYSYDPNLGHFQDSLILVKLNMDHILSAPSLDVLGEYAMYTYPNPAHSFIKLFFIDNSIIPQKVCLYSLSGELVFKTMGRLSTIDVSKLTPGFYALEVNTNYGIFRKKIIIY